MHQPFPLRVAEMSKHHRFNCSWCFNSRDKVVILTCANASHMLNRTCNQPLGFHCVHPIRNKIERYALQVVMKEKFVVRIACSKAGTDCHMHVGRVQISCTEFGNPAHIVCCPYIFRVVATRPCPRYPCFCPRLWCPRPVSDAPILPRSRNNKSNDRQDTLEQLRWSKVAMVFF